MKFCRIAKWRESNKIVTIYNYSSSIETCLLVCVIMGKKSTIIVTIYKCNRLLVWSLNRGFNVEPPIAFVLHLEIGYMLGEILNVLL
jgi:hypothetical protein